LHLRKQQFSSGVIARFVHDIFGWEDSNGNYHEGLVDCDKIGSFDASLLSLKMKWGPGKADGFSGSYLPQSGIS